MSGLSLLGVFAHPDDETSCFAALMKRYAAEGKDVHLITATQGEMGALGTNGVQIKREDLGAVRQAEQRGVLDFLGVRNTPTYLGYRDQEVANADAEELIRKVLYVMEQVQPDVIVTFGPTGLSYHPDHIAMHLATMQAFERYKASATKGCTLYYWALPASIAKDFDLVIEGPEIEPNVIIDVSDEWDAKVQALRMYASQEDAQEIAEFMERSPYRYELFHQVDPPVPPDTAFDDLFHD